MIRRNGVWLLGLLLSGCTLLPTMPALPTPVRPPELKSAADALQAAVEGDYPPDALTLRYQIGSEGWIGSTIVTVRGSGAVEVSFSLEGEGGNWSSSVTEDEFLDLCRLLVDHRVWAIRGQRETGVPDEAYPNLTVEAEGFEPLRVGMWHGEALEHADFKVIVYRFADIARTVSGGVAK
jgi:hypothetical protein